MNGSREAHGRFASAGRCAALVAALALGCTRPAAAHIVSDRGVVILRGVPSGWTGALFETADAAGLALGNRTQWRHVEHQADVIPLFVDACARSDSAAAERAWRAIDAALAHQEPAGDYRADAGENRIERLTRTSWWIAQLCRAEIVVMNSPLQKRFQWRVTLMRPKLRRSVDWLVAGGDELLAWHAGRPDLLLVDAQAFLLADGIFHEPRFAELGQRALVAGLEGERNDAAAAQRSLTAHARSLTALNEIATYFPMPTLDEAARRTAQRLDHRLPRGAAKGAGVDPLEAEALMALACHASRAEDRALLARIAKRVPVRAGARAAIR